MTGTATTGKVEFNTTEYQFSHGHKPRGRGYWMFQNTATREVVRLNGTITECKAQLAGGVWKVLP